MNKRQIVIEIICFLFIVLFVYAAVTKILEFDKFKAQIGQSPLLTAFSWWIAWIIPAIEIGVAILLSAKGFRLIGLYGFFSVMVMFTAYIVAILNFSSYIPCSCGGILEKLGWTEHLIFNIVFVLLALVGILLQTKSERISEVTCQ